MLTEFSKWLINIAGKEAEKYYDDDKMICLIPRETIWYSICLFESGNSSDIKKANKILENIVANDGTHSQASMVVIWHKYKDLLTAKAKNNILKNISDAFPVSAFSRFNDGNINHPLGAYCNLICGSELTGSKEIGKIGKKYLAEFDKQINKKHKKFAQTQVSEYFSPTYTALSIWFLNIISSYSTDKEIIEISRILEQRFWMDAALRFHAPTLQFAGPFSRAYQDDSVGGYSAMHCTMMKAMNKEFYFNPDIPIVFDHPSNYIQNALIALLDFNLPDGFYDVAFNKKYPLYFKQKTFCEQYFENTSIILNGELKHTFDDEVYAGGFSDLTTYMTAEYSLGTAERQYVNGGHTDTFVFRYRRNEKIESLKDFRNIHTRGIFNDSVVGEENFCHTCGYMIDKSYLYEEGRNAVYQDKNRALVLYTPKKNNPYAVKSFRVDIICNYYDAFEQIFINDEEITLFPSEFGYDDKIFISDANIFYSILPVRTSTVAEHEKNGLKNRIWIKDKFLIISLYSYFGDETSFSRSEIKKLVNGFIFEACSKDEYDTFDSFRDKIKSNTIDLTGDDRKIKLKYTFGEDYMYMEYDPFNDILLSKGTEKGEDVLTDSLYETADPNIMEALNKGILI